MSFNVNYVLPSLHARPSFCLSLLLEVFYQFGKMFLLKPLVALLCFVGCSLSLPTSDHGLHSFLKSTVTELLQGPPAGWKLDHGVVLDKETMVISLRIHLVQQRLGTFHHMATEVYRDNRIFSDGRSDLSEIF